MRCIGECRERLYVPSVDGLEYVFKVRLYSWDHYIIQYSKCVIGLIEMRKYKHNLGLADVLTINKINSKIHIAVYFHD